MELSANIYKIPENYYTINAGNIDFSNYPNGVENDYLTIRITNLQSLFSLPVNFTDWKDISPENLTTTFEALGEALLNIQKRLSDVAVYIDSDIPGQINLPKLPKGCTWYKDQNDNIVALPISSIYEKFKEMIAILKKKIEDFITEKEEQISGATYTPSVSEDGIISWKNDKGKPNPPAINIKGPAGTIEEVTASVTNSSGIPSVTVTETGTPENKSFNLAFENLKGDKPTKGVDYLTPQEQEQFTHETINLVVAEGQKVIEAVKKIIGENPASGNALTLGGKTRPEFEQDISNSKKISSEIINITETREFKNSNVKIIEGKILSPNGIIIESEDSKNRVTDYLSVIPGEKIYITGCHQLQGKLICFYDINQKFISQYPNTEQQDVEIVSNKEFTVPLNAKYVVVGGLYGNLLGIIIQKNISELKENINKQVQKLNYKTEHTFKIGEYLSLENNFSKNVYIDKTSGAEIQAQGSIASDYIDIDNIDELYVSGDSQFQSTLVCIYGYLKEFLWSEIGSDTQKIWNRYLITKDYLMGKNKFAKYVRFSSLNIPLKIETLNRKTSLEVYNDIINEINSPINILGEYEEYITKDYFMHGYINHEGIFVSAEGNYATDFISLDDFDKLYVSGNIQHSSCFYAIYDSKKTFIASVGRDLGRIKLKAISSQDIIKEYSNAKYIRISTVYQSMEIYYYAYFNREQTFSKILSTNILFGKKFVACGDSFTEGIFDFDGGKSNPELYDKANQSWKNWAWWIAHRNFMEFVNDGVSGSTMALSDKYINGEVSDINYANPFSLNRYKQVPKDADYLLLSFGLNELNTPIGTLEDKTNSTVLGAWNIVLEYFLTEMPYCKIGIIIQDAWLNIELTNAIKNVSKYWGISYLELKTDPKVPMGINGRLGINVNPKAIELRNKAFQISNEDSHPSPKGHKYRSTFIENFLRSL